MGEVVQIIDYMPRSRPRLMIAPATVHLLPMIREIPMTRSDRDVLAILRAQREEARERAPKPFAFVVDTGEVPFS